ncbi:hypothetical protein [Sphingomonas sp. GB1N7]|uniref:hypothetical protein n=1 Tax=Parasphingomonas caseinilytica TaxID=3096158 RepID=UPI002FCB2D32
MAGFSAAAAPAAIDAPSLYDKPAKNRFAKRHNQPKLSAEQAARQGRAVSAALRSFSGAGAGAAMDFLNADHDGLGRPLDLAIESAAGLIAVEEALARRASAQS